MVEIDRGDGLEVRNRGGVNFEVDVGTADLASRGESDSRPSPSTPEIRLPVVGSGPVEPADVFAVLISSLLGSAHPWA